jgi:hypothetical protein
MSSLKIPAKCVQYVHSLEDICLLVYTSTSASLPGVVNFVVFRLKRQHIYTDTDIKINIYICLHIYIYSISIYIYIYIFLYISIYMLLFQHIYLENGTNGKHNFRLFSANGKWNIIFLDQQIIKGKQCLLFLCLHLFINMLLFQMENGSPGNIS